MNTPTAEIIKFPHARARRPHWVREVLRAMDAFETVADYAYEHNRKACPTLRAIQSKTIRKMMPEL